MKKARIIVLSGQSNAVGVGHIKCLKRSFTEEKIEEYFRGYENIKINYYSHDKKSDGFITTATGCTELKKETIGPELGIAEYLTEKFPGEEFFIVKFAVGGANMKRDFLPPSSGGYYNVENFKNDIIVLSVLLCHICKKFDRLLRVLVCTVRVPVKYNIYASFNSLIYNILDKRHTGFVIGYSVILNTV